MEVFTPLALAMFGAAAANGIKVKSGGQRTPNPGVNLVYKENAPLTAQGAVFQNDRGLGFVDAGAEFDPVKAHFLANAQVDRRDNVQPLRTVERDPKYALTPESGAEFQYDQQNRGTTELENQLYYRTLTKDPETPLSMGFLPEYKRTSGVMLRDNGGREILKPQKRELLEEEVWVAAPEQDRRRYDPILQEQSRRARNESKYAGGNGALNGFHMNDRPGQTGGAMKGWSTGLEPTRQFTGYHPQQRLFRQDDNQRQRNPHGLRALNKDDDVGEVRADLTGQFTNLKKQQLSNYTHIPAGDGGRQQPHLPHDFRKVQLRYTARDSEPKFGNGLQPKNPATEKWEWQRSFADAAPVSQQQQQQQ